MAMNKSAQFENEQDQLDELQPGTELLHGQYTITRFLNNGGFGITYLAKDSLDRTVVIKECFADAFCRRTKTIVSARSRAYQNEVKSIVRHFLQEAHRQSKLVHPNIVGVHQVFEDNDTAYMALDFIDGKDLMDILDDPTTTLSPKQIVKMTRKLLGAIGFVHDHGLLHRDISPDNILLTEAGEPILIDFGAAREHDETSTRKHSALRVVKDGYSPQEFYIAGSEQGAWSDLYALAATLYHLIKDQAPINGQVRLAALAEQKGDPYERLSGNIEGYPPSFLEAIDKAMITMPQNRLQSATEWLEMLDKEDARTKQRAKAAATLTALGTQADIEPEPKGRGKLLAGSALVLLVVAGVVGYTFMDAETSPFAQFNSTLSTTTQTAVAASEDTNLVSDASAEETADVEVAAVVAAAAEEAAVEVAAMEAATQQAAAAAKTAAIEAAAQQAAAAAETAAIEAAAQQAATAAAIEAAVSKPLLQQQIAFTLWDIDVPFEYLQHTVRNSEPALITAVPVGENMSSFGDWIAEGVEIYSVNEKPLSKITPFATLLLNDLVVDPDGLTRASVRYKALSSSKFERGLISVPVVRKVGLADGTLLELRMAEGRWAATVSQAADTGTQGLQVGDILVTETTSNTPINTTDALATSMQALVKLNIDTANFLVLRNNGKVTVNIALKRQN